MSLATGLTADEFLARDDWPRGSQLISGEVIVDQPALPHQLILGFVYSRLLAWADAAPGRGLPCLSIDLRLGPADVYAPDLWWVGEQRRPPRGARGLDGLPDLVVEVRSPSTWRYDVGVKRVRYEQGGVAELWLVDTESRSVLVYRRSQPAEPEFDEAVELAAADGAELTSGQLPGFALPVERIFDV